MGVIGIGTMGSMHAKVYEQLPNTELVAIADLDIARAQKFAREFDHDVQCYRNYKDLMANPEIDAVSIALPDHLHKEPVIIALESGKHVLVEKPLATNLNDCDRMIRVAEECQKILMVNYTHRWAPPYAKAKELLEQGNMGQPLMAYARKNDTIRVIVELWPWLANSTPPAFLSSHDIDLVRWYFGCEAKTVYARGVKRVLKAKGIDTLDVAQALVEFENGAIATFESGWVYPNSFPTDTDSYMEIITENGVIHLDRKKEVVEISDDMSYRLPKTSISYRVEGRLEGAFKSALEHFVTCIVKGVRPITSGADARQVGEIVEAIHLSISSGEPVALPLQRSCIQD